MRLRTVGCAVLAFVAVCGDLTLEPLPLHIQIEASRTTAAPGDSVSFLVRAQGGNLISVTMDYGDGTGERFATSGARTAQITFHHVYSSAGTYEVRSTATDALAGEKDATVQVLVQ